MEVLQADAPEAINRVTSWLTTGGVVALPTETVYGLAAHALDVSACSQIFAIKGRPLIDPLIVHVLDVVQGERLAIWNETAHHLARKFWPGPLTMVLPKLPVVPSIVTAGKATVALRCPSHPLMRIILARCGFPLAAPSANPFGYVSPTRAEHVVNTLGEQIQFILDGGPCEIGIESTIIDLTNPKLPVLLRHGAVTKQQLEQYLSISFNETQTTDPAAPPAPGMLASHYSPHTPLCKLPEDWKERPPWQPDEALIFLHRPRGSKLPRYTYWWSEDGNLEQVAKTLYHLLQEVDKLGCPRIWFEMPPGEGLGVALRDRLTKAMAKTTNSIPAAPNNRQ